MLELLAVATAALASLQHTAGGTWTIASSTPARRCAAPLLGVDDFSERLQAAQEAEANIANAFADDVAGLRTAVFKLADPLRAVADGFSLPPNVGVADAVGELRDLLQLVLLQERFVGIGLLGGALLTAVLGGVLAGDRVSPEKAAREAFDEETFRSGLTPSQIAAFDEGRPSGGRRWPDEEGPLGSRAKGRTGKESARAVAAEPLAPPVLTPVRGRRAISAVLWAELIICVLVDACGDASLFYPIGEAFDLVFGFVSALVIELIFDWPALALFGLWEELLPFTDVIPTATIGWILVVVLGLRPTRSSAGPELLFGKVDSSLFGPGARPPVSDRRSYHLPEPWLVDPAPWDKWPK